MGYKNNKIREKLLFCKRCKLRWLYRGKARVKTSCPDCGANVVIDPVFPKDWKDKPMIAGVN